MARARNIKPGFFANEHLAECDPLARILFAGLWCLADRSGRLEDRPKRIRAELLPYDSCDAGALLDQLQEHGFVLRYSRDGKQFIQVLNFNKHQNPHVKEAASSIPDPFEAEQAPGEDGIATEPDSDEHSTSTVQAPDQSDTNPADSLSLDSLIPDSLIPDPVTPQPPEGECAAVEGETDVLFANFWKLYPRKTDKAKAQKAWAKLNPDRPLFEKIMRGLGNHCASRDWIKDDGQFIPHPTTWLNGKRWEDEVRPAGTIHQFPGQSRHTDFDKRDYTAGLTQREDGTYAF
ncbi:phage replication protein [Stutzerimonas nitrititolerans]|uniref:phage replication protein n=1 Tax=Stutzerimonas nitrititolerans TaxID=2482751 RepID=UPI0028967A3C|nr:phage replication protein [Stutzerimonas nitrititolerans]